MTRKPDPIEGRPRRSLKNLHGQLQALIRTRLWTQILVGMVLGVGVGVALGPSTGWFSQSVANAIGNWVALPGHIFLKLVQMIVMALIIFRPLAKCSCGKMPLRAFARDLFGNRRRQLPGSWN